jgi:RNA polymerase sigma-70 factor (ECF subfamily)
MTSPAFAHASFHSFRALVARALARRGVAAADRDDLVQEVFLVLHRRGVALADDGATRAWLRETAWRVASNHRRGRRRADDRLVHVLPGAPTATPEELTARAEIADRLASFLADLPSETRALFERIEIEGESAPEVARATGANLDTVYAKLRRTRVRWAAKLASLGMAIVLLVLAALASQCATQGEPVAVGGARDDRRDTSVLGTAGDDGRSAALRSHDDQRVRLSRGPRDRARPARMSTLRT